MFRVNMRGLPADALNPIWTELKKAARDEANNPATVPAGQFRTLKRINPDNGQVFYDFIGQESFVKDMGRRGRRVISFRTDQGPVDASGRFLR